MPANLITPCSGLSDTHSNVPYGTRKRNPLAATAADSAGGARRTFMVSCSSSASRSPSRRLLGTCAATRGHRLRAGGRFSAITPTASRRSTALSCRRSHSKFRIVLSCAPRTTTLGVVWRDGKPNRGVDFAPGHRGAPRRRRLTTCRWRPSPSILQNLIFGTHRDGSGAFCSTTTNEAQTDRV